MRYPIPQQRPMVPQQQTQQTPQVMTPPRQQGGFMPFLQNNSNMLLNAGIGLMSGQNFGQQLAGGFAGAAQGLQAKRDKRQTAQKQNKTLAWLQKNAPEYVGAVDAGVMTAGEAYKMKIGEGRQSVKPTATMQEYQFAVDQGFDGSFMDFQSAKGKSNSVNINMPGAPNIGSIPQGFQALKDPETGNYRMERIPGGPEDTTKNELAKVAQEAQKASVAREAISSIRSKITGGGPFDMPEVGVVGGRLGDMGLNQEAVDVKNELATLQSIVSFDRLQAMREASPTGGALGAVSERELALLQSSLGALSNMSSPEQLAKTLDFIDDIMSKFEAYPTGNPPSAGNVDALIDKYAD